MRLQFITRTLSKSKVDTHFGVVSITHKLLPYFANIDDIHFSAISNQTNFSIDKHMSYITTTTDKHMSCINIPIDKHMSCINTSTDKHMSYINIPTTGLEVHPPSFPKPLTGLEVHPPSSPKPWSTSPISSHTQVMHINTESHMQSINT